jgi:acyl-CoA synthetase (AMP-forming)/AMP-acid ligase II
MAMTLFTPPPPGLPVPDAIFHVAHDYPDREVVLHMEDNAVDDSTKLSSITWRQLLTDVSTRVDYFMQITGLPPRQPGDDLVVVGLLAENTYHFILDLFALFFLRWTVNACHFFYKLNERSSVPAYTRA